MASHTFQDVIKAHEQLTATNIAYWTHNTFLTYQWWILVGVLVIPWVIWYFVHDKSRNPELVPKAFLVMIIASLMDSMGTELHAWGYPHELLPLLPRALAFDLGLLPVMYMLLCQYFVTIKRFLIATLVMALFLAFVGEPITIALKVYKPFFWRPYYSFPIYFLLAVVMRWITAKLVIPASIRRDPS
ncbi:MAG TPA: CBO0543 family protein [Bacilli bacterium]|nr:CBO0543 family protein [Bacilli bacterium]